MRSVGSWNALLPVLVLSSNVRGQTLHVRHLLGSENMVRYIGLVMQMTNCYTGEWPRSFCYIQVTHLRTYKNDE